MTPAEYIASRKARIFYEAGSFGRSDKTARRQLRKDRKQMSRTARRRDDKISVQP